jgi:hypothetical protein
MNVMNVFFLVNTRVFKITSDRKESYFVDFVSFLNENLKLKKKCVGLE